MPFKLFKLRRIIKCLIRKYDCSIKLFLPLLLLCNTWVRKYSSTVHVKLQSHPYFIPQLSLYTVEPIYSGHLWATIS